MQIAKSLSIVSVLLCAVCAFSVADNGLVFEDVTESSGLAQYMSTHQLAHGAAWGDVDGNGRPDLYVAAYADRPVFREPNAPIPNMLFLNMEDGFVLSKEKSVRLDGVFARTTIALFVDLDNDNDLDLLVGNNVQSPEKEYGGYPSVLFENTGKGHFHRVQVEPARWFTALAVRNISPVDIDQDGRLDLIMTDGHYRHLRNDTAQLVVLRNLGGWKFEHISDALGLPKEGTAGLGLAVGDINHDGRPDIFVAESNRLLISAAKGKYRDWQHGAFEPGYRAEHLRHDERMPCGAIFGDLNGDDLLDLVVTTHGQPAELYLYMNEGTATEPHFVDRTTEAGINGQFPRKGLTDMPVKTAHVELRDMDNDGHLDIYVANSFRTKAGVLQPMVLRNLGVKAKVPRFTQPPFDRCISYYCPAPVTDFDRDGRLDIFLGAWFPPEQDGSHLFRNMSDVGHWIDVLVHGARKDLNTMGIGAVVRAYRSGHAGDAEALLGRYDIVIGVGYASGQEARAHIGLGKAEQCDLTVSWQGEEKTLRDVQADQCLDVPFE